MSQEKVFAGILRPALWAIVLMLSVSAVLSHVRLASYLDLDAEILRSDSETLYAIVTAREGKSPYHDYRVPPHVVAMYGPLFYFVPGLIARSMRADWLQTVVVGRGYGYLFYIAIAVLIYALARQSGCSRLSAAVGGLLWLATSVAPEWAVAGRPDSAALFFSLAAFWLYRRGLRPANRAAVVLLLSVATLHKQSAVVAMAIIAWEEFRQGRGKQAVALLGCWCAIVALGMGVTQMMSGHAFWMNAFKSLPQRGEPAQVLAILQVVLSRGAIGLVGAILAWATVPPTHCPGLLRRYFLLALTVALAGSLKSGATVNYYLEPFAVGSVLTAILVNDWLVRDGGRGLRYVRLGWLGLALGSAADTAIVRVSRAPFYFDEWARHRAIRSQQALAWDTVIKCLGNLEEPVLIEDMYLAFRRQVTPYLLHAGQFAALRQMGLFDDAELLRRIESGKFAAIVCDYPLESDVESRQFPLRWIERMRERYQLVGDCRLPGQDKRFYLYRPRRTGEP